MADHEKIWRAYEECFNPRRWNAIRASWPRFMGKPIEPPGSPPETTLSELLDQGGLISEVPEKNKITSRKHSRAEVPEIVFREAVYWLHKGLHVLGASETHIDLGLQTWSLSAAYQSS